MKSSRPTILFLLITNHFILIESQQNFQVALIAQKEQKNLAKIFGDVIETFGAKILANFVDETMIVNSSEFCSTLASTSASPALLVWML